MGVQKRCGSREVGDNMTYGSMDCFTEKMGRVYEEERGQKGMKESHQITIRV